MFEALRKKSLKSALVWAIILIIIGLGMIFFQGPEAFRAAVGYTKFESLAPDEIGPRMMVDVELTANFGYFIEEYEENTSTHYKRTTDLYYVIWTGDDDAVDYRYMAIKVPVAYKNRMEEMANNTYEGYLSDPISFSGEIRKMDSEEYRYFKEYFTDGEDGWTTEEFEEWTLPYYIQTIQSKASTNGVAIVVCLIGAGLLIWGIIRICRAASGASLKSFRKAIAAEGYSESMVESDYNSAQSFTKDGSIKIGRLFIYYMSGSAPKAIPVNKIQWAYQITTTHRRNGIKTGTTYSIMIYVESGERLSITLAVPNEAVSQAILEKMGATFPWVVVGFSDEIKRLFNKDRAQFLALRYNTVEHVAVDPAMAAYTETSSTSNTP